MCIYIYIYLSNFYNNKSIILKDIDQKKLICIYIYKYIHIYIYTYSSNNVGNSETFI